MKQYTKEHLWLEELGNGDYNVGITVFAAEQMNGITYVELPVINKQYCENELFGSVESVKNVSDLAMPAFCTVVAVNDNCLEYINDDAEGKGYVCTIKNPTYSTLLMSKAEYDEYIS